MRETSARMIFATHPCNGEKMRHLPQKHDHEKTPVPPTPISSRDRVSVANATFSPSWMCRDIMRALVSHDIRATSTSGQRSASQSVFFCILLLVLAGLRRLLEW